MKKTTITLCTALLLLAGGCSNAVTKTSTSNETLISVGGEDITIGDVYAGLVAQGNITPVTKALTDALVEKAVPVTKEIEAEAQSTLASYKASTPNWEEYLKTNGYKNEKDFYKKNILLNARSGKLTQQYIKEEYTNLTNKLQARKLQIVLIKESTKVQEATNAAKKEDFEKLATTYGDTTNYKGVASVYTNKSGLPGAVWEEILKTSDGEVFSNAINDPATGSYYLVKVVSSNTKKFKEEASTVIANLSAQNDEGLTISDEAYNFFLDKYNYSIHDATVYSALLSNSGKYKK